MFTNLIATNSCGTSCGQDHEILTPILQMTRCCKGSSRHVIEASVHMDPFEGILSLCSRPMYVGNTVIFCDNICDISFQLEHFNIHVICRTSCWFSSV